MKKILLIIFLFFCCTNVYALESRFSGSEFLEGISYMKYDGHIYHFMNAKVIRNSETNEVAYCISPFDNLVDNSLYTSSETYDSNFGISKSNWEKIKLISYYGYGYKDHTDNKWISITQMMIWRTLYPDKTFEWIDNTTSRNIIHPYDNELSILTNLVNTHNVLPNIEKDVTYNLNSSVFLIDYNRILSNYDVKESDFKVTKRNDGLQFDVGSVEKVGKIVLERASSSYKRPVLYFYSSSSQSIIQRGNIEPITYEIKVKVTNGKIIINKIDAETKGKTPMGDAKLDGAIYELYGSRMNYITEKQIENNVLIFDNLTFGNYYVKEKKAGDGYYVDDKVYEITLNKDNINEELTLENIPIKYKLKVIKKDSETESVVPQGKAELDGAVYSLYDSKMEHIADKKIENNELIFDDLPYGKYYIKEKSPGLGYYLDEEVYEVSLTSNNLEEELILRNKAIKSKIRINKYYGTEEDFDNNNMKKEENAYFEIISNDETIYTGYTDINGVIEVSLPYGDYIIRQLTSKDGYKKVDDYYLTINEDSSYSNEISFYDLKIEVPNAYISFLQYIFNFIGEIYG